MMKKEMPPEPNWYQGKWRRARHNNEEVKGENKGVVQRSRNIALSGPLDGTNGRVLHEKMMNNSKLMMKLSGPLDGKVNNGCERVVFANANRSPIMSSAPANNGRFVGTAKSPRLSGPLDARSVVCNRSPRLPRPLDERAYSKVRADAAADYDDDDYAIWPTLFEDLKPT